MFIFIAKMNAHMHFHSHLFLSLWYTGTHTAMTFYVAFSNTCKVHTLVRTSNVFLPFVLHFHLSTRAYFIFFLLCSSYVRMNLSTFAHCSIFHALKFIRTYELFHVLGPTKVLFPTLLSLFPISFSLWKWMPLCICVATFFFPYYTQSCMHSCGFTLLLPILVCWYVRMNFEGLFTFLYTLDF